MTDPTPQRARTEGGPTAADYDCAERANVMWGAAINGPHVAVLAAMLARTQRETSAAEEWSHYMDQAVSNAPEPLQALGKYLAGLLDEDRWPEAERYLNAAALAMARPAVDELIGAATDALAGWRYIRANHGDLYGVGWDRVEDALRTALQKATGAQS